MTADALHFRTPTVSDGPAVREIVQESGVLDLNSRYHYLLFCRHFADTTVVAEMGDRPVGFVTAFLIPTRPDTVFVWQIGVDSSVQGHGVGRRLLEHLVQLPSCRGVTALETTVTPSNTASDALFRSFARERGAGVACQEDYFPRALFEPDCHEAEVLYRIAPLVHPAVPASGAVINATGTTKENER